MEAKFKTSLWFTAHTVYMIHHNKHIVIFSLNCKLLGSKIESPRLNIFPSLLTIQRSISHFEKTANVCLVFKQRPHEMA